MAKGQIELNDILKSDAAKFGDLIAAEAKKGEEAIERLKESAKDLSKLSLGAGNTTNEKELVQAQKERLKVEAEIIKNANLKTKAEAEIVRLNLLKEKQQRANNKLSIEERVLQTELNKVKRAAAKETLGITGAYAKLNSQRTLAKNNLADLLSAEKRNETQIKNVRAEYKQLNTRILAVDRATDNYTKNIGNYGSALNNVRGIVTNLGSALGVAGGIFGAVQVFKNAITQIRDFEKANATLAGVLQQTKGETKELREDAIRLGESTVKTASEVTSLQIAYARLGFTQREIIDLTGATISGSIALNSSLDETASLVGAVVNSYDELSSTDAGLIIDQLSLSTASSALNFEKLSATLPIVLGAANSLNVPLSEVLGTLSKTADAGIEASTAATSLRNIYIESAARGIDYKDALEEVRNSTDKLSTASELFGKRAAVSALVIAKNTEGVDLLSESYENAAGTAERMANNELDTLDGSLKLLNSAWEGYILNTGEANDVSETLKDSVKFLAENLKDILKGLVFLTKAFIVYKTTMIATNLLTKLFNKNTENVAKGLAGATKSAKGFNQALKANVIGIVVTGLFLLYEGYKRLSIGILETNEKLRDSNSEFLENSKNTIDNSVNVKKLTDRYKELTKDGVKPNAAEQKELSAIVNQLGKNFPQAVVGVDALTGAFILNTDKISALQEGFNGLTIDTAKTAIKELTEDLTELEVKQAEVLRFTNESGRIATSDGIFSIIDGEIKKVASTTSEYGTTISNVNASLKEKEAVQKYINNINNSTQATRDQIAANEDLIGTLTGDLTARQIRLKVQELENEADKNAIDLEAKNLEKTKENLEDEEKIRQSIFELTKFRLQEKARLYKEEADNESLLSRERIEALSMQEEIEIKLARLERDNTVRNAKNNTDKILANEKFESDKLKLITKGAESYDKIYDDEVKKAEATNKAILDGRIKFLDLLSKENKTELNNALSDANLIKDAEDREKAIYEIKKKYAILGFNAQIEGLENVIKEETLTAEQRADLELKVSDIKRQLSEVNIEVAEEETSKLLELYDTYGETFSNIASAISDLTNTIFDARVEKIDNDIAKSEEYYDRQIELAGDDERQKEALEKESEQRTEELNARKNEELRKQAVTNKLAALAEIAINTAVAVSRITRDASLAAPLLIPGIIALGAVQAATVLATPIPQYEKGTENHGGGLAEVAEVRPEVIIEPNKKPYIVSDRSVLDLPKGTEVVPSVAEFRKRNHYREMRRLSNESKTSFNVNNTMDNKDVVSELKMVRRQLAKQKQPVNNIIVPSNNNIVKKGTWNAN